MSTARPGVSATIDTPPRLVKLVELLSSYPRSRPTLSQAYQQIYVSHYLENREGTGSLTRLKNGLEAWMHRRIASRQHGRQVLEIGAGTLNHLSYEPADLPYDTVEPFRELWNGRPRLSRVRHMYESVAQIPEGARYDRIISVAVLEHLTDLPQVVAATALRLHPDGRFQAGIPSEGGFLWGLAWRLTTGLSFRFRTGLSYADMMRYEHVNTAPEILAICRWLFDRITIERFPSPLHHFSFYTVFEARAPRIARCRELLNEQAC